MAFIKLNLVIKMRLIEILLEIILRLNKHKTIDLTHCTLATRIQVSRYWQVTYLLQVHHTHPQAEFLERNMRETHSW